MDVLFGLRIWKFSGGNRIGKMQVVLWLHPLGVELWQASCLLKEEMVDVLLRPENFRGGCRLNG